MKRYQLFLALVCSLGVQPSLYTEYDPSIVCDTDLLETTECSPQPTQDPETMAKAPVLGTIALATTQLRYAGYDKLVEKGIEEFTNTPIQPGQLIAHASLIGDSQADFVIRWLVAGAAVIKRPSDKRGIDLESGAFVELPLSLFAGKKKGDLIPFHFTDLDNQKKRIVGMMRIRIPAYEGSLPKTIALLKKDFAQRPNYYLHDKHTLIKEGILAERYDWRNNFAVETIHGPKGFKLKPEEK